LLEDASSLDASSWLHAPSGSPGVTKFVGTRLKFSRVQETIEKVKQQEML
jgi:hypothetical protein